MLDVSGSMNGFPLDTAKTLIKRLISGLKPADHFNVLLFAGDSRILNDRPVPATAENVRNAVTFIEEQTEEAAAPRSCRRSKGRSICRRARTASRSIVVITDGYVNVEKETFDLIRKNLGRANLFAFGIGSSVNRYLIEGMARAGTGEHFIVTNTSDASRESERFRSVYREPGADERESRLRRL